MAQPAPEKSNRRNLILVAAAAIVGLAVVAVVVALAGRGPVEEAGLGAEGPYRGSEPPARITLPGFDLASYRGGSVSAADLRGSVVLLTLLDSSAPMRARFWPRLSRAPSTASRPPSGAKCVRSR